MARVTVTAKRQATLPKALCEDLGVGPGDKLELERRTIDGESVWVVRAARPDWTWIGAAAAYGSDRSHAWEDIEESIAAGFASESE